MPRTGSYHLVALLNEHPNVASNGEILNPYDPDWPNIDRSTMSDRQLLELAFLRFPLRGDKGDIECVGCKINEPQVHPSDRPGVLVELARWPHLKVIFLHRRNMLESYRSLVQARQSGRWFAPSGEGSPPTAPQVTLIPEACMEFFQRAEEFHRDVSSRLAGCETIELYYEDMGNDPIETMARLWHFLGVRPHPPSNPPLLQRQERRPLSETLLNYDELRRYFQSSPYLAFFEKGQ